MVSEAAAAALASARQTLAQNRLQLARLAAGDVNRGAFPRSATFRWIAGHLNARALAATAVSAVLARPALLQTALSWLWSRRPVRRR